MAYKSLLDHEVTVAELIAHAKLMASEVPIGFSDYDRALIELIANVTPGLMEQYADDPNLVGMLVLGK